MAELYETISVKKKYWDRQTYGSLEEQNQAIAKSATLYVGNLSFFTTETQIYEVFSSCGHVQRVIMGLDRFKKTPCGFCFVEYNTHDEAVDATRYISGTKLDNRVIRCDVDGGFKEGRQFGRGNSGGQVRDERRSKDDYDPGRGGFGKADEDKNVSRPFRRRTRRFSDDRDVSKRSRNESIDDKAKKDIKENRNQSNLDGILPHPSNDNGTSSPPRDNQNDTQDNMEKSENQKEVNPRFRDDDDSDHGNHEQEDEA